MKITLDIPMIKRCDAVECIYNLQSACHAKAITIGDGVTPGCDTFMGISGHVKNIAIHGGVGACKVSGCSYNTDFECAAESINIGKKEFAALCMTYMPR